MYRYRTKANMSITTLFKHDTKRVFWLLGTKIHFLSATFTVVAVRKRERKREGERKRARERERERERENKKIDLVI